jgi:hypothetical protein
MERKIQYTYRARLLHLEDNGEYVADDLGDPIVEEVDVRLSWSAQRSKRPSPRSSALYRLAAKSAMRKLNSGMDVQRQFEVDGVRLVHVRTFPV